MTYAEERAAQLARLDAHMAEHPPTPDTSTAAPDAEPDYDDEHGAWTSVGCWPPAPMGARR